MTETYMSGSEYSASLSAALNSYWQALEVRWIKEAGKTLYGRRADIPAAPEPIRWQVPPDSWRHLQTCPIVAWAMKDGTPASRPNQCDGWSVPDAKYVECQALDVFRQVADWAWAKRDQLSHAVPDLAAGPELSFLQEAHGHLRSIGVALRSEGSVGDHELTGAVNRMAIGQDDNVNRGWLTGWTGLAANAFQGGFLTTVKPTMVNQAALCDWLASCYAVRGTIIHATRNNILNVIGHLTRELGEVVVTPVDHAKEKLIVSYASQVWTLAQITFEVLKKATPVGTVLGLVEFILGKSDSVKTEYKYAQLSDFFALVDTSVRTLHSEMDGAEADYAKAVTAINSAIASRKREELELFDMTQHSPNGDSSDPSPTGRYAVDVNVVLKLAQDCYTAAEGYSELLRTLATVSYSDGQLAGRGLSPIAADLGVVQLREDLESFFTTTTTRYLTAADRIKAAAKLYVQNDEYQRERYETTIEGWRKLGLGEYGRRNKIDTDPHKEGVQN